MAKAERQRRWSRIATGLGVAVGFAVGIGAAGLTLLCVLLLSDAPFREGPWGKLVKAIAVASAFVAIVSLLEAVAVTRRLWRSR